MGILRVTQRLIINRSLNDLADQQRRVIKLQEQLATGQRINRISDDPLGLRRAIDARTQIAASRQFLDTIQNAGLHLEATETAALTVNQSLQRVDELLIQGSNGTVGQEQRNQIATEINELIEGILNETNQQQDDRYLFAGTATSAIPFNATRDANGDISSVAYAGNDEHYEVEISQGSRVPINITGAEAFTSANGGIDLFDRLIQARDALRAGNINALNDIRVDLDQSQNQILTQVSRSGSLHNRLERVAESLDTVIVQLEEVRSYNVDADVAEVIVELNAQSNTLNASLNAMGRIIQPSLLDFLR